MLIHEDIHNTFFSNEHIQRLTFQKKKVFLNIERKQISNKEDRLIIIYFTQKYHSQKLC